MNTPYDSLYLFIGGKWIDADGRKTATVRNPATEEIIGQVPLATAVELDLDGIPGIIPLDLRLGFGGRIAAEGGIHTGASRRQRQQAGRHPQQKQAQKGHAK